MYKYFLAVLACHMMVLFATAQQVYFIDGYHGGVYGHYPKQYTAYINETLDKHPQWYINLEIEPETWDTVAKHEPANYQRFKELITDQSVEGRIEYVNPAYGQPYFYNITGESIIRQFSFGIDKLKKHFPNLVFTTYSSEEPCFTSAMPQILRSFGFKYASLKNPNTCWGGYTRNYGGELINWQGPDGTLLPAVPRYGIEALDKNSTWQTTASTNSRAYLDAAFKAGISHPIGMCLQDAGWKVGPWLKENQKHYPTQYTTWRKYMKDIVKDQRLPSWRFTQEDVQVSLVWGAQVLQQIARQVRYAENKLLRAEKIAALAGYPSVELEEAWRQVLLSQHHDCWIVPYNGKRNNTWIDKVQRWTDSSNNIANRVIKASFKNNEGSSFYVRVINTNADELNGYIHVPVPSAMKGKNISVQDVNGNILPSQAGNELIVKARIPGISAHVFKFTDAPQPTGSLVSQKANGTWLIQTDLYKIIIDPSKGGSITSLIAKKLNNKEFVDGSLNELKGYFFRDSNYFSSSATPATVKVINDGALSASVQINGTINQHPFAQVLTVYKDQPLIDVKLTIDWKGNPGIGDDYKQHGGYKAEDYHKAFYDDRKKLQTLFPLNLGKERVYKNAPFDVTESRLDNTYFRTWDSIKNNVLLNWVDVTDQKGEYGFALFTDHTTAYTHGPGDPLGLVTQYAGVGLWGRNYSITGPTELHYAFFPHAGNWVKAGVWPANLAWNNPPEIDVFTGGGKTVGSLFTIAQKGFELTAMEKRGDDLLVRLFNPNPAARKADIHINGRFTGIEEQELDGRVIRKIAGNPVVVQLRGFGLTTLIIKNYEQHLSSYINPFIGASTSTGDAGVYHGLGKTFPGAATPFGLVQVSPNTITGGDNGNGFSYEHTSIEGFALTQMSGVGWFGDLGNFLVTPTTGPLRKIAGKTGSKAQGYRSTYDAGKSIATAGYYSAVLSDYEIKAELTAAPHAGMMRFTFPANKQSRIQIDLARRVGGTSVEQSVKRVGNNAIEGWMKCTPDGGGWGDGDGKANYTVYFRAEFSKPFTHTGVWSANIPDSANRHRENVLSDHYQKWIADAVVEKNVKVKTGKHLGFYSEFNTKAGEQVLLKVGISFTDLAGARANLANDIPGWNFDGVHAATVKLWDSAMARIRIETNDEEKKKVFYTAMYHSMIDPRNMEDVNGNYIGADNRVHTSKGFTKRTVFSGWDVFRSQMPLQTIINPAVVNDIINSLIGMADQSGKQYLERWELLNAYTGCMIGNPAIPVIADAYAKGIRDFDVEKALKYAVNSVEKFGNGDKGFSTGFGISHTLEYAFAEDCVAELAKHLNKPELEKKYRRRGQSYRNIFDDSTGWFRPKRADGSWEPYPALGRLAQWYGCVESNPYQQGWFVPHDVKGMVELMGGNEKVRADLENMFAHTPENMMWNDYYNHANEPVHHVPFLFNRVGAPWLTQKWTRTICNNAYKNEVNGLVGNEDVGQMSAWYILASIGFHPIAPGHTRYELTSPVFDRITITLDNKGKTFIIIAKNNSAQNLYIQSARLNGKTYDKCYIDHTDIMKGGTLELEMGSEPNKTWGL